MSNVAVRQEHLTIRQWLDLDDEIEGELADNALVPEEMPNAIHETIVLFIASILRAWLIPRGGVVVEIITDTPRDTRRDRIEKAAEYAAFGVRFYWLVDPTARTLEIFERVRGKWMRVAAAEKGKVKVPSCAGLVLDLGRMWTEVDALG